MLTSEEFLDDKKGRRFVETIPRAYRRMAGFAREFFENLFVEF